MATSSRDPEPDFRALFEGAPVLFLVLAPDLKIVAVSDAYLKATMTKRDQILGRGLFDVFPDNPDDASATGVSTLRGSLQRVIASLEPDTMAVQKYDIRRPGGGFEERWWSPRNSPVRGADGKLAFIIHQVEDATDFVRMKQAGAAMEREVFQRGQELAALNEKLRAQDRMKTQFFANVSHELRTPLGLILGPAEKLLEDQAVVAHKRHDLEVIVRNAKLLLRHVNDLLDIAKLDAGRMQVSRARVDLAKLVRQVAANFESFASQRGDAFTIDAPGPLEAEIDPEKVERILMNLLANAFKFTPKGGRVRVALRRDIPAAGSVTLDVADNGPGVPANLRDAVFERFVQAEDSSTRQHGGTGLGLAIVREFTQLHGGAVSIGLAPEGGALFTVVLPLKAPAGSVLREASAELATRKADLGLDTPSPSRPDPLQGTGPLILVVEDNADMAGFIRDVLAAGYRTAWARNGREGLDQALALLPDLILSDFMMPGMSGEDMARAVRARPELDSVPLVFLTAKVEDAVRVRMLQEGAQDFILKPFVAEELRARLGNLIARKKSRDRLEAQFLHSQKMEAVGRLAGGIAHDFNNLLTVILGYAELAISERKPGAADIEDLEEIHKAAKRASGLTRQLLAFSRRQVLKPEHFDLNLALQDAEKMLARLIGEDISLRLTPAPGPLPVRVDRGQLDQVIANLVVNARDAMPRGGKLTLESTTAELDASYAAAAGNIQPGKFAVLAVSDTGHGIPPEVLPHIFEPFYTTKEVGKGTGLGLSTSFGIVKQSGGHMMVYSEPGKGTTFRVYLPLDAAAPAPATAAPVAASAHAGGETVFVVEDEDQVRRLTVATLTRLGYRVLDAPNGPAALSLAASFSDTIHLLLTDVVMPGIGGRELAAQLTARRPGLRVLFCSGYTADAIAHHGVLDKGVELLEKPFTQSVLAERVRSVLSKA